MLCDDTPMTLAWTVRRAAAVATTLPPDRSRGHHSPAFALDARMNVVDNARTSRNRFRPESFVAGRRRWPASVRLPPEATRARPEDKRRYDWRNSRQRTFSRRARTPACMRHPTAAMSHGFRFRAPVGRSHVVVSSRARGYISARSRNGCEPFAHAEVFGEGALLSSGDRRSALARDVDGVQIEIGRRRTSCGNRRSRELRARASGDLDSSSRERQPRAITAASCRASRCTTASTSTGPAGSGCSGEACSAIRARTCPGVPVMSNRSTDRRMNV